MDNPKTIGRYEILEELGRGAMGMVYRAKDPSMDRTVALKTIISVVLASAQGNEFRERFYREARAAGALAHPGIVPVFDVGEHEGMPYLVMEFVTGRTLADVAKKGEQMGLDRVCEIGQRVAEALGYAHQRGVVHRDVKPANILLTSKEAYGIERPKITDFGVAKLAEGHTTLTGQMVGTPAFMPPEQFTGAPIDGRADIFSLGVVLYWMATGEQPFPGESITAVSYKVVHTDPVPPRKLNPMLPARLNDIILKCLAKNPAERYQTGEELARDLGELRTGATAANLQTAAPQKAATSHDPDATVIESAPRVAPAASAATSAAASSPQAAPKPKSGSSFTQNLMIAAAVVALILVAGGLYIRHRWQKLAAQTAPVADATPPAAGTPAAPVATPAPAETSAPPAAPTPQATHAAPVVATTTARKSKTTPAVAPAAPAPTVSHADAKSEPPPPPKPVEAAPPQPAALGFDPKALDPKQNTRLKIEDDQMPVSVDFSILMDGKLYYRRIGGAQLQNLELYVPPGLHEFRIMARKGAVEKTSNTVSNEFKAKKKTGMKIELRTQGAAAGSGMPQDLYPDTQIVLTLK